MKILQVCNRIPFPPKDGGSIGIYNYTKEYSESGNEVTMLAMNTKKHFINLSDLPKNFTNFADIHSVYIDNSIKTTEAFFSFFKGECYILKRFISKEFEKKLIEILEKNKFDIVHLDGLYVSPYTEIIRQYSNAKIVYRAHNVEYLIWERMAQNTFFGLKKIYFNTLAAQLKEYERQQLNKFDLVVAITHEDEAMIKQLGCKAPIIVSPAGLELEKYEPDFSHTEFPSLFYIGGLDWMPNQEGLLWFLKNIWAEVHKEFTQLKFYIAGRNMPKWFGKLKYPNVMIVGEVEDAMSFMNSKSIMLVPLLSGGGMRIKIIEGMAMGKAIISTSIGAEGIVHSHWKNILIADKPYEFVRYISQCVSDKLFCEKTGNAAMEFVKEKYDNKKVVKELIDYYKNHLL